MNHVRFAPLITRHSELQQSILKTLAYFDLFSYPLDKEEIRSYLFTDSDGLSKLTPAGRWSQQLDDLVNQVIIEKKDEFYFLPGREEIVETRKERYKISLKKIKKARRIVWWLRFIPWIKAIFIGSSLGFFNASEKSDIDLLIITSKKSIWPARFWSVGFLKILGLRPGNNNMNKDKSHPFDFQKVRDKFCLSYFITEDNLDLSSTKINDLDINLVYLLSYYLPLYTEDNLWQKFRDSNRWTRKYLPNLQKRHQDDIFKNFLIKPRLLWLKKLIRQTQFRWEEKLVKRFQLWYMPKILKDMANKDRRVIINDRMIKLHSNDKRVMYYEKWQSKIRGLITDDRR